MPVGDVVIVWFIVIFLNKNKFRCIQIIFSFFVRLETIMVQNISIFLHNLLDFIDYESTYIFIENRYIFNFSITHKKLKQPKIFSSTTGMAYMKFVA